MREIVMQGKILEELEKKVNCKKLKYNDIIQVLRGERKSDLIKPIIDIYYDDEIVNNMTTIKDADSVKEKIDKRKFKEEYLKVKPRLERTTVMSLIVELREEKEKKK